MTQAKERDIVTFLWNVWMEKMWGSDYSFHIPAVIVFARKVSALDIYPL